MAYIGVVKKSGGVFVSSINTALLSLGKKKRKKRSYLPIAKNTTI